MDIVVIGGVIGFVGFLAIVAAVPTWGQKAARRIWIVAVGLGAIVLAVMFWPRPATGPGYFVVINGWTDPVIAQLRGPLGAGHAFRLDPRQFGPLEYGWPAGTEVFIFTADCQLLATSHIEGRYRGTVLKGDGSIEIHDLGDMGSSEFQEVDRCQLPSPTGGAGA
jgi:hypothetical protein